MSFSLFLNDRKNTIELQKLYEAIKRLNKSKKKLQIPSNYDRQ